MRHSLLMIIWIGSQAVGALVCREACAQNELPKPPPPVPVDAVPEPPVPQPPVPTIVEPVEGTVQPPAVLPPEPVPDVLPPPRLTSGFGVPEGLKTAPEILLPSLGYGTPHCFPLTPSTCYDVGYKCYTWGLYQDALAFANHGLALSNHARLYLLKAMCEMQLARCDEAIASLTKYRHAALRPEESVGLWQARETLNDPMRVRLERLLTAWPAAY